MKLQVAILVPIMNGKVLILKRTKLSSWPGYWNFPGGSVESEEFVYAAAIRELEEESGLKVDSDEIDFLETIELKDKIIYLFATDKATGVVKINQESSDYAWINLEDIYKEK
jgi:8-oxo-dGTP diphosphatase